ncbi:hypothetical protein [Enhygromyxa salina]|uniref:Orc1-like AAA ATPase domain-containing protein n=1 Tax=Enhygromyxa salina TaxID=215803 RepID=A0A2S9YNN9_9BACT|nr:hypothetical protein [Enhygromyxa salina]PRQ06705.1 hypothetical protein ENSA7_35810 [Enhygromyxa salina]
MIAAMPPAQSINEAAHSGLLDPRFSPWSDEDDASGLYVERPSDWTGHPGGPAKTLAWRLRTRLLSTKGDLKILFTGQVGSGKSSELEQLWQDQDVANHFERLRFVATDEPLDLHNADMRQLLVALAAALARHLAQAGYNKRGGEFIETNLRKWIELLGSSYDVVPPNPGDEPTVQFGAVFMKFSAKLRSEASLRARIREDDAFGVVELRTLTSDLMTLLRQAAARPVLIVFDDLDKLSLDAAKDIFFDHMEVLQRLGCSAVITYPYVLSYHKRANAVMTTEPVVLENVETIQQETPGQPLQSAIAFFTELIEHRVQRSLVSDEAISLAVANCAGIPREFVRILQRAFLLADEYGQAQVGGVDVQAAIRFLLRHLSRTTQSEATRNGLIQIRKHHRLAGPDDWELVQALLAVEYTNGSPWYDVHPILAAHIDELIAGEAASSSP